MTLLAAALAELETYEPSGPAQRRLREDYLACARSQADALWRTGVPDHLTASALVVSPGADKVLLALHGRVGRWLQTGGHLEAGDGSLAAAALREGTEESGLDLVIAGDRPVRLDAHPAPCDTPGARRHLDVQYVAIGSGGLPVVSDESLDVRWFAADDLPEGTDDSVRALVAAARALLATR